MSTPRGSAIARIRDALVAAVAERYGAQNAFADSDRDLMADAVVNAIYPEITDAKQMLGVPAGSILISPLPPPSRVTRIYAWDGHDLHMLVVGGSGDSFAPAYIIKDWGPLTVVWMP